MATVKPAPAPYQGQAWAQYAVPGEISVRRGTVALPALTSAPQDRILRPGRLVYTAQRQRVPPVSETPGDGKYATSRPPESARPFPWGPRAINQM